MEKPPPTPPHRYKIRYKIDCCPDQGWLKDELEEGGFGGCDAVLIASIVNQPSGGVSMKVLSGQPNGQPLPTHQLLGVLGHLAEGLRDSGELDADGVEVCKRTFANVRDYILARRDPPLTPEQLEAIRAND